MTTRAGAGIDENKRCESCSHWCPCPRPDGETEQGECRCKSPRYGHETEDGQLVGAWVITSPDEWCGEHDPLDLDAAEQG